MIGSLFAGVGGLDWAVEHVTGLRTAWQLDLTGADVRGRHWPGVLQVSADVATVDPRDLPRVSVLVAGFACQDLSVAGPRGGLDEGGKTGPTYRHTIRYVRALRPEAVVIENVPALLTRYRARIERDLGAEGYAVSWVRARALDGGHPHLRRRVFALAVRGLRSVGVVDAPRNTAWSGGRLWPTPTVEGRRNAAGLGRNSDGLETAVRPWPPPTATDARTAAASERPGRPGEIGRIGASLLPSERGSRLSPDWTEALMGFPVGWTLPRGERMEIDPSALAVRGRYPESWDRSQYWPGWEWEPVRTLPDGAPVPGRPARLRYVGNAVCPQQAAVALGHLRALGVW